MAVNPEAEALKALIREARETLKDLKQEKKRIDEYIKKSVYNLIDDEISKIVGESLDEITREVKSAEAAINRRFDNIEEDLLGGKKKAPIENLIARNNIIRETLSEERAKRDL